MDIPEGPSSPLHLTEQDFVVDYTPPSTMNPKNVDDINPYLIVTGSQYRSWYFIALRFKNPIINHKSFGLRPGKVSIPPNTCLIVEKGSPMLTMNVATSTMFFEVPYKQFEDANPSEEQILKSFFLSNSFVTSTFQNRTLYAITHYNPFKNSWKRARRNVGYKGLGKLFNSCITRSIPFSMDEAATLRYFKRNGTNLENFSTWYPLAQHMAYGLTYSLFHHEPSAQFGRKLFQILKRSKEFQAPPDHPPTDFYTCQVTLSDTEPVGIACRIIEGQVEYVSVMIISYTKQWFLDTNNMACCFETTNQPTRCRHWFPLLKDGEMWLKYGILWYTNNLNGNFLYLTSILDWLSIQTSEPYRNIRKDLMQVYRILYGTLKSRWS